MHVLGFSREAQVGHATSKGSGQTQRNEKQTAIRAACKGILTASLNNSAEDQTSVSKQQLEALHIYIYIYACMYIYIYIILYFHFFTFKGMESKSDAAYAHALI